MRIRVEELELHPIVVSKTYASGALDYHGTDFRQAAPLKVDAVAELVGSEIRIRGRLGTRLEACCDRCLGSVAIPVEQEFDLFYRPVWTIAREEEVELPEDELGVGFFSGDGIELADVVTEQVILAVPMKVVCQTDCRGLCPVCGANLNFEKCGCLSAKENSPFSSLKEA
ncbi:MAG: DUF177 domain-containing protein [Terriglobia bacterium]